MQKKLILLFSFFAGLAHAQDFDTKSLSFGRNQLPDQMLPATYTTYSAAVNKRFGFFTNEQLVGDYLALHHFKLVDRGGHFFINVVMEDFVNGSALKKETSKQKDKSGKEITATQ